MGMRRTKGGGNWRVSEPVRSLGALSPVVSGDQSLYKEKAASFWETADSVSDAGDETGLIMRKQNLAWSSLLAASDNSQRISPAIFLLYTNWHSLSTWTALVRAFFLGLAESCPASSLSRTRAFTAKQDC